MHRGATSSSMAAALMSLHITANAERLPAAGMGAFERFFAGVAMVVDAQAARP